MRINKKRKQLQNIFVVVMCICGMTLGYAIATQSLNINGTAKTTGVWDVKFINITSASRGGAVNKAVPSTDGTTATFSTTLNEPGDKMTYTITVKNNGTIDAIVESITLSDSTHNDISYTYSGISEGNILEATKSQKFVVFVEYDKSATSINKVTETATITINYKQKFNSNIQSTDITNLKSTQDLKLTAVTSGDGLYADEYESGRYIFKGASPNNYITFNNEDWRILSIEDDGTLKIVKHERLNSTLPWDSSGNRNINNDTYCTSALSSGCNAWTKTNNLFDSTDSIPTEYKLYYPNGNSSTDSTSYSGSVTSTDASLNTYLNDQYYNSLGSDKKYIINHKFNVSTPGYIIDNENISLDIEQEKAYKWLGKVGLITVTEYMRTTTNTSCTSLKNAYHETDNGTNCGTNNWMTKTTWYWTISPFVDSQNNGVWGISWDGGISRSGGGAGAYASVYPVVYLAKNIQLIGDGSQENKYQIVG